jgi:two-component system, NarL family, response regulator LiaR
MGTAGPSIGHRGGVDLVRLWLVDDHELVTEALAARLGAFSDLWVLGRSTTDDPNLAARVERERPNVISVDPDTARVGEAELFTSLRLAAPSARIVVLSGLDDTDRVVAAARLGADAWVPKEASVAHVVQVLRGTCRGEGWFPPHHLGAVLRGLREDVRRHREGGGPLAGLSGRERQVLLSMVDGLRGAEIATELGLSANTVRTHTHSLYAKLGVHSRLAAVSTARAAGLLPRRHDPIQTS